VTWGVLLSLAGIVAVLVASSILTISATAYMTTICGAMFKPAERRSPAAEPNSVYDIEVSGAEHLRLHLLRFPGFVRFAGSMALIAFLLPTLLAVFLSAVNGFEIDSKGFNVGPSTKWVNDLSYFALAAMISYPVSVISFVYFTKLGFVTVLRTHAELKAGANQ
jgi:hypothetical protein